MIERDERALQEEINRAEHAQRLLNDELLIGALDAIEAEVIKDWGVCPARDVEGREIYWQLYKSAQSVRALLLGYIETGKLASINLEHAQRPGIVRKALRAL